MEAAVKECIIDEGWYQLYRVSTKWEGEVVLYITSPAFGNQINAIYEILQQKAEKPFTLCELVVGDWDQNLTPWPADCQMKDRYFYGNGNTLLEALENHVIPALKQFIAENTNIYLAGYSLAGLFSLWCFYEKDLFAGVISCSGSLWYPGWKDYIIEKANRKNNEEMRAKVYVSLGKKEEKTKHPVMKLIGENTRLQHDLLLQNELLQVSELIYHDGGHFTNVNERVATGILWMLS